MLLAAGHRAGPAGGRALVEARRGAGVVATSSRAIPQSGEYEYGTDTSPILSSRAADPRRRAFAARLGDGHAVTRVELPAVLPCVGWRMW